MTTLASLLAVVTSVIRAHPLCRKVSVLETKEFSPAQFFLKVRADLANDGKLQVRIYHNRGHMDYAYQLFLDAPILRWDNKEEFRHLTTYPHHHDENGTVTTSPLRGEPAADLRMVLEEISVFMSRHSTENPRRHA